MNRPLAHLRRKRAVLYLRQSTYREESISLELQETAGRAYCERMGYDVVGVEADPGISGRTWKRPAVQRVMEMLENGGAEVIVLWRWSRLSRSRKDWALAADRADLAGGSIESATEPNDATAAGRFARGVMTELAAFESERIGEQWKEAHARRRRLGLPADGGPRYGYDKIDGTYVQNETEAALLAEMYRRYLGGQGYSRIVAWLNRSGHLTRNGHAWSRITVTHLLDSGFGAGKIVHRATSSGGKRDWNIRNSTFYPGAHEPVITEDEWEAYVALRMKAPAPSRVVEPKYFLTGLIFCGDCGAPMHVGNEGLKDYKCSRAAQKRDVPGMYMTRVLVERRVREWVEERASRLEELAEIQLKMREQTIVQLDNVAALDRKLDDLREQLGRITVRWSAGKMLDDAYDAATAQLGAEMERLTERRRQAAPTPRVTVDPTKLIVDLAADWDDLTVLELRNMLGSIIRRVQINKPPRQGIGVWRDRVEIVPVWASTVG